MFTNRIMIAVLSIAVFSASNAVSANAGSGAGQQQAAKSSNGPVLGKWEFTGKDNTGLAWTGTLVIEKLDPNRFDANKYHSYTAVLSGDIRSLTRGKRTESKKDAKQSGQSGTSAVSRACPAGRILAEPMAVCRSRAGQMGPSKPRLASARRRWRPGIIQASPRESNPKQDVGCLSAPLSVTSEFRGFSVAHRLLNGRATSSSSRAPEIVRQRRPGHLEVLVTISFDA